VAGGEWTIKRNCSITPRQLGLVYAMLCLASFGVATVFALRGAWYVLIFAILEMGAVGMAFLHFGRHATDREHIVLTSDCLTVKLIQMEKIQCFNLDRRWIRIEMPILRNELIGLEDRRVKVGVGRYLTDRGRRKFAQELRRALSSGNNNS
jgi:uncharacterized membrane protein